MKKTKLILSLFLLGSFALFNSCGSSSSPNPTPPTPPTTCTTGERTFTMANNSGQEIWIGITAGSIACDTDADCPTGATGSCDGGTPTKRSSGTCSCTSGGSECGSVGACNTSNHFCFWNLPTLTASQINLANGAESTICFPAAVSGKSIQWSGNLFARTGCNSTGQQCQTGDCGANSSGICPAGTGGNPPDTLAEFTLSNQSIFTPTPGDDFYDISIINGINVGISMAPATGTFAAVTTNPYSCTAPGSTSTQGTLSACSWSVNPTVSGGSQATLLRDVAPITYKGVCPGGGVPNSLGYCACTTEGDCPGTDTFCGLALNASSAQYTMVCGTDIGWWSGDQLCGSANGVAASAPLAPLNCSTNYDMFLCTATAAQSCYNAAATTSCCGCATSASADGLWPTDQSMNGPDNGCYSNNPTWVTNIQPWLVFMKQTCPTAYTYPFDDATSTFTCLGSTTVGAPNYSITFLPTD
jgi:hypothetical protein